MNWRTSIILALAALAACTGGRATEEYTEVVYEPAYASGFRITGADGCESTMIEVRAPWQGADSTMTSRLLILRGDERAPEGFDGQVLRGDARRIVCMSSSYIAMLEAVGEIDRVAGVSGLQFISNPKIHGRKDVGDVGYDGNIDYERLVALDPDLVLLYGVNSASAMEGKLRELEIPYAYVGEYLEQTPLGKAEWMVAIAEMCGARERGEQAFARLPERYDSLRQVAAAAESRPKVMVNTPYADSWLMPTAGSYIVRLIEDAGGEYVYAQKADDVPVAIDAEEAYMLLAGADCWVNVGRYDSLERLVRDMPRYADTPAVRTGEVYNSTRLRTEAGGNEFWESAAVHPDDVLADFIKMLHPELLEDTEYTYYERLGR